MKTLFALLLIFGMSACASSNQEQRVFLKRASTDEIVKCEKTSMDEWFDAVGICVRQKTSQGFKKIIVTEFDAYGIPVEYHEEEDPFWP